MTPTPVALVVRRFGGAVPLARLLGCSHTTIYRWKDTVPSRWQGPILKLAKERNIRLRASDLIGAA